MNYRTFDRHANMTAETLSRVNYLISEMMLDNAPKEMINQMYGLFDGYYYNELSTRVLSFYKTISPRNYVVALKVFYDVLAYDCYLPYGDESPEEVARMTAEVNLR
jgi:hypothetical protein